MRTESLPLLKRLLRLTDLDEATGCWVWKGKVDTHGYGRIRVGKKQLLVHRVSFAAFVRPLTPGLVLDHRCRVRRCLNPEHLEEVTSRQNTKRGFADRRAFGTLPLFGEN